jgi:hypothetical protein
MQDQLAAIGGPRTLQIPIMGFIYNYKPLPGIGDWYLDNNVGGVTCPHIMRDGAPPHANPCLLAVPRLRSYSTILGFTITTYSETSVGGAIKLWARDINSGMDDEREVASAGANPWGANGFYDHVVMSGGALPYEISATNDEPEELYFEFTTPAADTHFRVFGVAIHVQLFPVTTYP